MRLDVTPPILAALALSAVFAGPAAHAQNAALDRDRAYAAEVLADAGLRASQIDGSGVVGRDGAGFFLGDASGDNTFRLGGFVQARYLMAFRSDEAPVPVDADFIHGFENRNVRLDFTGTVFSRQHSYKVRGNFGNGAAFSLDDAWIRLAYDNGLSVKVGQFKLPLWREFNIDAPVQLAVERSQSNSFVNQGYTQGIEVMHASEQFRVMGGFSDGARSGHGPGARNSAFDSPSEADWAVHARADFMIAGSDWKRFDQFTSFRSAPAFSAMVGGAVAFQQFGNTGALPAPPGEATEIIATIDATLQGPGWNAFGAFLVDHFDPDAGSDADDLAFLVQGGIFVTEQLEAFGRWDTLVLDDATLLVAGADDNVHFITVGVNYYISPESHALKLTADAVFALNETHALLSPLAGDANTGLRGDPASGEVNLRVQLQLRF